MVVVCAEMELFIADSRSLKDKRQVLSSLRDRIRHRFEVATAEVDHQDVWQRSRLAMVTVSAAAPRAHEVMDSVVRFVESDLRIQVLESHTEEL